MRQPLIINVSQQMSWARRCLTWTATAALWIVWLLLWGPIWEQMHGIIEQGQHLRPMLHMMQNMSPVSLSHAFFALVGTASTLLLWTFLPGRVRTYHHGVEILNEYARYFHLAEQDIAAARQAQIVVVHHDDDGHITQLQVRD